ncbi:MAG: M20/M25/M40 family metallo-hydrolase [Pseudomonadota bacterium]
MRVLIGLTFLLLLTSVTAAESERQGAVSLEEIGRRLLDDGMRSGQAMALLTELCEQAPHRQAGSGGGRTAETLGRRWMERFGFQEVRQESFEVRHWERGPVERAAMEIPSGETASLTVCALGGSVGTRSGGITAPVLEVGDLEEVATRADEVKGRIVFFNRPMDPTKVMTFQAYGGAADQRVHGPSVAAKYGAVGVVVRSMTLKADDVPHTGIMIYEDDAPKIPAAALGFRSADRLAEALKQHPGLSLTLELSAKELPPVEARNTLGQITGSERPEEVVVLGCHLDAWDKGCGAHDDGAGCAQAVEALRLLGRLGLPLRRTVRVVLYMDEEMGGVGGKAYAGAEARKAEPHVYAIESDRGGFVPLGFSVDAEDPVVEGLRRRTLPMLKLLGLHDLERGGGGVDIGPLVEIGCTTIGLIPDSQRYFDVHHSDNDVLEAVHPRELELGAIAMAALAYALANESRLTRIFGPALSPRPLPVYCSQADNQPWEVVHGPATCPTHPGDLSHRRSDGRM